MTREKSERNYLSRKKFVDCPPALASLLEFKKTKKSRKNMIVFTFRELKRAWRQAGAAFNGCTDKTNSQRLLLFYAVETGLKAVILKRKSKQDSEGMFADTLHDLNKLLKQLSAGANLHLPKDIRLDELKLSTPPKQRNATCGDLNQVWRYGAEARNPTDAELEAKLSAINEWIRGELK